MTEGEGIAQQILTAEYTTTDSPSVPGISGTTFSYPIREEGVIDTPTEDAEDEYTSYERFSDNVVNYIDGDYLNVEDGDSPTRLAIFLEGCKKSALYLSTVAPTFAIDATDKILYWMNYSSSEIRTILIPWLEDVKDEIVDVLDVLQIIKKLHANHSAALEDFGILYPAIVVIFKHSGEDGKKEIKLVCKEDFFDFSISDDCSIEILNMDSESYLSKDFKFIEDTLERFYNKENYDIQDISPLRKAVILYYPEIEITNSLEIKHIIKELYVRIEFDYVNKNFIPSINLVGYRGKISNAEYNESYYHSHLSGNVGNFCLGSSELRSHLVLMNRGYTQTDLEVFFILLDNYVRWESLEGVPYKSIKNLYRPITIRRTLTSLSLITIKQVVRQLLLNPLFMEKIIETIKFRAGSVTVPKKQIPVSFLKPIIDVKFLEDIIYPFIESETFKCFCDYSGNYYNTASCYSILPDGYILETIPFPFKGKTLQTTIYITEKETTSEVNTDKRTVHPYITSQVAHYLIDLIYLKWQQR